MTDPSTTRRNIGVLTAAQALGGASAPIVMSLGGLVGQRLATDPALITLPVSLFSLGLALGTLPAAFIMRRHGRRNGYVVGVGFGVASGLIAALGILLTSFWIFCVGTFLAGFYGAYVQSYRFAAADTTDQALKAKAISWVMVGGLAGAIIGPQLVIFTRDTVAGTPYVGAFLSQALLPLIALPILLMLRTPRQTPAEAAADGGRTALQLLAMPRYLLAVAAGVVSYGTMALVMTAAPVAMVNHGHSVDSAALGIQWHLLAMFGPSLFTGRLMVRYGKERVIAAGMVLLAASAVVALSGLGLSHFWGSLALLGMGWNFGFIGATAMVTDCHSPAERSKAQGMNDFFVFAATAAVSFLAGSILHSSGWRVVNWMIFPALALILVPLLWQAARNPVRPSPV
ncbi:MFS transporter [Comamonas serinivorans]|uniref:MFS transporter n=1 Tax=Comamonas serinivorans TaxID=1082851 RepID=A0A1Y0EKJ3_9BURK|nr:MFS transporter [Comamonas serinivorans]ARU03951.1 MFS transporter [Comamonas serinivorans]